MRARLPNRRPSVTSDLEHKGRNYSVAIGFDPVTMRPMETFISGQTVGSDVDIANADASVLISLLLQHGADPQELSKSLLKEPDGKPASIVGAVIELVKTA